MILYSHNWNDWHYFDLIALDDEIVETEILANMPLEARVVEASRGEVFGGNLVIPLEPTISSNPNITLQGITDTLRILIVDDENFIRLLLRRTLEELEFEGVELLSASLGSCTVVATFLSLPRNETSTLHIPSKRYISTFSRDAFK